VAEVWLGYTYQMDIYVSKKAGTEVGLGESVVWEMTKSLIGTGCRIFMDNFLRHLTYFSSCMLTDLKIPELSERIQGACRTPNVTTR